MKKKVVIAALALVALKFVYNIFSFIYDTQDPVLEKYFNYCLFFIIAGFGLSSAKPSQSS